VHLDVRRHRQKMSRRPSKSNPPQNGKTPQKPARQADGGLVALTSRENEVLGWMAEGKRDAEIGTILGTSVRTVHKHVQHILNKLGAETRTCAARIAMENGLAGNGHKPGLDRHHQ
jgi:DNA-binding NarL/FixJ family response regulator